MLPVSVPDRLSHSMSLLLHTVDHGSFLHKISDTLSAFGYEAGRRHSRNSPNGTAPDNNYRHSQGKSEYEMPRSTAERPPLSPAVRETFRRAADCRRILCETAFQGRHQIDHPGRCDTDRINIRIAIAGLRRHIMADDRASLPEIEALIEATHYPYKTAGEELDLLGKILRDADLAQVFSPVWIQQVVSARLDEDGRDDQSRGIAQR
jgi:hypothetical protein